MITSEQIKALNEIHSYYLENMKKYAMYVPSDYCSFVTYKNEVLDTDKNIVVQWTRISSFSDNLLPETETIFFLIEETGFFYDMASLQNLFSSTKEMYRYIDKLTKFDWNGK
jgi:hypothetical protein